jgi:hypothetical protein
MAYEGYDYSELLRVLGFLHPDDDGREEQAIGAFADALEEHYVYYEEEYDEDGQLMILEMREFLTALIGQDHTYVTPLWKGLLAIECDWTFAKYFVKLIRNMWD